MNEKIVSPMISANIYFPAILTAFFLTFFLPASSQVFLSSGKREYGILFSLGMSRKEAFWKMLLENTVVAVLALAAALPAGTALSLLFLIIIQYGIGIEGLHWEINIESYTITILLYAIVILLTFIRNAGSLFHESITVLLKTPYCSEKTGLLYRTLCRLIPKYMKRHLTEWSFLQRHKKEWRYRYLFAVFIVTCSVTLASVCMSLYPAFQQDALNYSPYDMVYSEIYGMNQIPEKMVTKILEENGTIVTQVIQIPYIRNASFNFFPIDKVNHSLQCDYQIEKGQFLNLFQYDPKDGYRHDQK